MLSTALNRAIVLGVIIFLFSFLLIYFTASGPIYDAFHQLNKYQQAFWLAGSFTGVWGALILSIVWMCRGKE